MHPVAHHTGEEILAPLLLLGSGGVGLLVAIAHARLAAARAKLTRKQGTPGTAARRDRWLSSR